MYEEGKSAAPIGRGAVMAKEIVVGEIYWRGSGLELGFLNSCYFDVVFVEEGKEF